MFHSKIWILVDRGVGANLLNNLSNVKVMHLTIQITQQHHHLHLHHTLDSHLEQSLPPNPVWHLQESGATQVPCWHRGLKKNLKLVVWGQSFYLRHICSIQLVLIVFRHIEVYSVYSV